MFWAVIFIAMVVITGVAVLVGLQAQKKAVRKRNLTRAEQMTAAKASGVFKHQKSSR